LEGMASINPNRASVRSAAGANHKVDGDLAYEIDGREIPADCEATGNYAAYAEAIDNAYLVGSPVVRQLAQPWSLCQDTVPTAKP
jgi:purine nucleoside permease